MVMDKDWLENLKSKNSFLDFPLNTQLSMPGVAYNGKNIPNPKYKGFVNVMSQYTLPSKPNVKVQGDYTPISINTRGFVPPTGYPPRLLDDVYLKSGGVFKESF